MRYNEDVMRRSMIHIRHYVKKYRAAYVRALPLLVVAVLVLGFTVQSSAMHKSPEVAFTDEAPSGLSIVPASCPSSPDSADTTCGPPPTTTQGRCDSYGHFSYPSGQTTITETYCDGYTTVTSCPSGYTYDGYWCVAAAPVVTVPVTADGTCPTGYTLSGTSCVFSGGCPLGYTQSGTSCSFTGCPLGYTQSGTSCVFSGCPIGYTQSGDSCVFSGCPSGYYQASDGSCKVQCTPQYLCGADNNLYHEDSSCNISSQPTQICGYGCSGNACLPPMAPQVVTFSVSPTLVKNDSTTVISWSVKNATQCTVTGTNGDGSDGSWTCAGSACDPATPIMKTSGVIVGQTIYTLRCSVIPGAVNPDGTPATPVYRTATVNIIPGFNEQ
jgi:hypothetical protein